MSEGRVCWNCVQYFTAASHGFSEVFGASWHRGIDEEGIAPECGCEPSERLEVYLLLNASK